MPIPIPCDHQAKKKQWEGPTSSPKRKFRSARDIRICTGVMVAWEGWTRRNGAWTAWIEYGIEQVNQSQSSWYPKWFPNGSHWFPLVPIGSLSLIFRAPILTLNPGGLGHSPWPTICRGEFHWWCTRPVRGASRWINPVEKVATNWLRFRRVQESISSQLMSVISQIISLSLFMSIYLPAVPTTLPISLSIQIQSTSIHL